MNAEEAKNYLIQELCWPAFMVELGIRANFCCEYCGKNLLESIEAYDSWQKDHIIPNGNDDLSNLALACKICNFAKRHTDPTNRAKGTDRESLIQAAKEIIDERLAKKEEVLVKTRVAVQVLMNEK